MREGEADQEAEKSREAAACMQRSKTLHPLDLRIQEMQQLQEGDETLATVRKEAERDTCGLI